jgi:hypothetical protein
MARVLERSVVEKNIKKIKWEYVSPDFPLIHEEHDFVFLNREGEKQEFSFTEVFEWLYDEDYVGCSGDCDRCLTPICGG